MPKNPVRLIATFLIFCLILDPAAAAAFPPFAPFPTGERTVLPVFTTQTIPAAYTAAQFLKPLKPLARITVIALVLSDAAILTPSHPGDLSLPPPISGRFTRQAPARGRGKRGRSSPPEETTTPAQKPSFTAVDISRLDQHIQEVADTARLPHLKRRMTRKSDRSPSPIRDMQPSFADSSGLVRARHFIENYPDQNLAGLVVYKYGYVPILHTESYDFREDRERDEELERQLRVPFPFLKREHRFTLPLQSPFDNKYTTALDITVKSVFLPILDPRRAYELLGRYFDNPPALITKWLVIARTPEDELQLTQLIRAKILALHPYLTPRSRAKALARHPDLSVFVPKPELIPTVARHILPGAVKGSPITVEGETYTVSDFDLIKNAVLMRDSRRQRWFYRKFYGTQVTPRRLKEVRQASRALSEHTPELRAGRDHLLSREVEGDELKEALPRLDRHEIRRMGEHITTLYREWANAGLFYLVSYVPGDLRIIRNGQAPHVMLAHISEASFSRAETEARERLHGFLMKLYGLSSGNMQMQPTLEELFAYFSAPPAEPSREGGFTVSMSGGGVFGKAWRLWVSFFKSLLARGLQRNSRLYHVLRAA